MKYGFNTDSVKFKNSYFINSIFHKFFVENEFKFCKNFNSCDYATTLETSLKYFNNSVLYYFYKSDITNKFSRFFGSTGTLMFGNYSIYTERQTMNFAEIVTPTFERCFAFHTFYDRLRCSKTKDFRICENKKYFSEVRIESAGEYIHLNPENWFYYNDTVKVGLYSPNELPH